MMYLFLTALLALNVSKEVLKSFIMIEHGVGKTVENFSKKNDLYYGLFSKAAIENPTKAGPWNDKALQVKAKADETVKFLRGLRERVIRLGAGIGEKEEFPKEVPKEAKDPKNVKDVEYVKILDNMDYVPQIMIQEKNGKNGEDLKNKINDFREFIIKLITKPDKNKDLIDGIKKTLNTDNPPQEEGVMKTWQTEQFQSLPLIASVVFMTIIEGNIRNAEADILAHLYSNIDAADMKFNKIGAIVNQNSAYILAGTKYSAQVFLAAYDSTQKPTMYIGDFDQSKNEMVGKPDTMKVENGQGIYETVASGTGKRTLKGAIKIKSPEGFKYYPFEKEWNVMQGGTVVSPTKMNCFYRSIANPVEISAVGVPPENVTATMTNGNLKRASKERWKELTGETGKDGWEVLPGEGQECMITVMSKIEGQTKQAGQVKFRVKNIPNPVAMVGGQFDGKMTKNGMLGIPKIIADLKDFAFDLKFTVTSYEYMITVAGFTKTVPVSGENFSPDVIKTIKSLQNGQQAIFQEIKARGPDNKPRKLNPIILTVK
ncbi:MAG: gliding motility protein GldM [Bacteroidia bacterium]|nr:gliding motility protein GldM [Bacteroidia bacterium]